MAPARAYLVVAVCGAALATAFPEIDLFFVSWLAIAPLIALAAGAAPGRAFALGLAFGIGFFGTLLHWISLVGWAAWVVLVVVQAVYLGMFGLLWSLASRVARGEWGIAVAPAVWVAVDFARGMFPVGGFTWGQLAQAHTDTWILRSASLAGGWTVAFIVVAVNAAAALAWQRARARAWPRAATVAGIAVVLLAGPIALGPAQATGERLRVAIVQGNVPTHIPEAGDAREAAILASHRHLTRELEGVDLVVWPESAVGFDPFLDRDAARVLRGAARDGGADLVVGGNLEAPDDDYLVVALHVDRTGEIVDRYVKTHLVPFGEYVPARLSGLAADPRAGADGRPARRRPDAVRHRGWAGRSGHLLRGRLRVAGTDANRARRSATDHRHEHLYLGRDMGVGAACRVQSGEGRGERRVGRACGAERHLCVRRARRVGRRGDADVGARRVGAGRRVRSGCHALRAHRRLAPARLRHRHRRVLRDRRVETTSRYGADMTSLVIVPTYNEAANIRDVVRRLFAAVDEQTHLLVVDDRSPDGTARVVEELGRQHDRIHLLERGAKLGLGTAYVTGFRWALERGYDAVLEMDADLSHDPRDAARILAALDDADVAIGSRYVEGGGVGNWGPLRRLLSMGGNVYARAWLGYPVRDSTSGFRAYRADFLAAQDLGSIRSEGYGFQIEMTRRAYRGGKRIVEVPITFIEREHGRSKMSRRIVFEALVDVTRWGLRDRLPRGRRSSADRP